MPINMLSDHCHQVPLGLGPSTDVVENLVPMMAAVESAFDDKLICAVPEKDSLGLLRFVVSFGAVHKPLHVMVYHGGHQQLQAFMLSRHGGEQWCTLGIPYMERCNTIYAVDGPRTLSL